MNTLIKKHTVTMSPLRSVYGWIVVMIIAIKYGDEISFWGAFVISTLNIMLAVLVYFYDVLKEKQQ